MKFIAKRVSSFLNYLLVMGKWLENFSLQTPLHWWVFLVSGLFVVAITVVTVSWQSWKTATENPMDAIRIN
ncbi:hypothetical protein [Parabacteroides bouchesdurhonensis]|uniref:hypothetical protein n=1 Tax=Parabacteroides bouchesdurhonensis TaxID=1936995 RepID=UPI000C81635D|nr:hypothetical protein [Parabacteroides bouchesdurhonensis]